MKSALAKALAAELEGQVTESSDALDYFATDGSIFTMRPQIIAYPKHVTDVRKAVNQVYEQAKNGKKTGLVARGKGTDQAGGALGDGLMLVFPAHMNHLLKHKGRTAIVQPGLLYGELQRRLKSSGQFLPPYPSSIDFSSIGGAVANNACGEKTVKYGATRDFIRSLQVVLSNGDLIETKRLTKAQVRRKQRQTDFEGEIYRQVDSLLEARSDVIHEHIPKTSKNAAGYALWHARGRDGSIDLSQLIAGSQGTLGVVTEITLRTVPFNPRTTLMLACFDTLEKAGKAVEKLMPLKPSALEVVDIHLLEFLKEHKPAQIKGIIPEKLPKVVLFIEFDDTSQIKQTYKLRRSQLLMRKLASKVIIATDPKEQAKLWDIRHSAAAVIWQVEGGKKALPVIEDGVVPVKKLPEFLEEVYRILGKYKLDFAVWGHAGDANLHLQPYMDLSKITDRDKIFLLADEFYSLVIRMGGSTCGEHNDGLMRAPYLKKLYGEDVYELFREVKQIFDPLGILNPGKKLDVTVADIKPLLRHEYSMKHLYDHMPTS